MQTDNHSQNSGKVIKTFLYTQSSIAAIRFVSRVRGVTILDDEMFIILENGSLRTYDTSSMELTNIFNLSPVVPNDIASCSHYKIVYITDLENKGIGKYNPKSESMYIMTLKHGQPFGVSVTKDHKVLITLLEGVIIEMNPEDDKLREIRLDPTIIAPIKTIEISKNLYAVGHGASSHQLNRVCLINGAGEIQRSYGSTPGDGNGKLNLPVSLAFDEPNDILYVADGLNHRVVVLNSSLTLLGYLTLPGMARFIDLTSVTFDLLGRSLFISDGYFLVKISIPIDKLIVKINLTSQVSIKAAWSEESNPASNQSSTSNQVPIVSPPKSSCCIIL